MAYVVGDNRNQCHLLNSQRGLGASFGNLGTESPFGAYKRVLPQYPFLVLAVRREHWNLVHQNRERKRNVLDWECAGLGWGRELEGEREEGQ